MQSFALYASIFEEQSEKKERLIRCSREVTLRSKKVIFALQR